MTSTEAMTQWSKAPAVREDALHILLVRHGETDANRDRIAQGHRPTSLNALGRRQAALVARRLAAFAPPIELIISSDLPRTMQTAAPLAERLGLSVQYDPAWRERCYGIFEGKGPKQRDEIRARYNLGPHDTPPGAQTRDAFHAGIRTALLRLVDASAGRRCVAVVTHGGACNAVAMMLSDGRLPAAADNATPAEFNCPNASVTHLIHRVTDAGPEYRYGCVFDVQHLEGATVTNLDCG
ncbi:MAG: histidine phosphatase family protein [Phycisphaeraceae bacterium]